MIFWTAVFIAINYLLFTFFFNDYFNKFFKKTFIFKVNNFRNIS